MNTTGFANFLKKVLARHQELESLMHNPEKLDYKELEKVSKEYSSISNNIDLINQFFTVDNDIADINDLIVIESDGTIIENYKNEIQNHILNQDSLKEEIQTRLIQEESSEHDNKDVILEIRSGTGGDEAALFVSSLLDMYTNLTSKYNWKIEQISCSYVGIGGMREVITHIKGNGVFNKLKFESGVHRVQRVPETETSGRVHTSTAMVAVLLDIEEVEFKINPEELKIDTYRSSGPGGQSVNTTDSAVRIRHIPTGTVVTQQDEKSQHKNKEKALKILRARLYDLDKRKKEEELSKERKSQVGSGERSERIRTYNFPQSRVTDHRVNYSIYGKLEKIMEEGSITEIIEELIKEEKKQRVLSLYNEI